MNLIAIGVIIAISSFVYLAQTVMSNMRAQERLSQNRNILKPKEITSCFRSCMDRVSYHVDNVPTCTLACKA